MAAAKPLTGVGVESFSRSYGSYASDVRYGTMRAAHSTWFGVLGDMGYPGLLLLIGNLAVAVWSCLRTSRIASRLTDGRELRIYANALMSAILVFCVSGSFLSLQYSEMVWHFVGLSTALYLVAKGESLVPMVPAPVARG